MKCELNQKTKGQDMLSWQGRVCNAYENGKKDFQKEIIEKGFFKVGTITYMLDALEYPHDERCEGSCCWCSSRAKREKKELEA